MEPEDSLPRPQENATGLYTELNECSTYPRNHVSKMYFNTVSSFRITYFQYGVLPQPSWVKYRNKLLYTADLQITKILTMPTFPSSVRITPSTGLNPASYMEHYIWRSSLCLISYCCRDRTEHFFGPLPICGPQFYQSSYPQRTFCNIV